MAPNNYTEPGIWCELLSCASTPIGPKGAYDELPHLGHKSVWKERAVKAATVLCPLLRKYGIHFPNCSICGPNCMIEGHIQSPNHFKRLWSKLQAAERNNLGTEADEFIQDYQVLNGRETIRFNHAELSIQKCIGTPPPRAPRLPSNSGGALFKFQLAQGEHDTGPSTAVPPPPPPPPLPQLPAGKKTPPPPRRNVEEPKGYDAVQAPNQPHPIAKAAQLSSEGPPCLRQELASPRQLRIQLFHQQQQQDVQQQRQAYELAQKPAAAQNNAFVRAPVYKLSLIHI